MLREMCSYKTPKTFVRSSSVQENEERIEVSNLYFALLTIFAPNAPMNDCHVTTN
jgi:hypothetical protein